MDDGLLEKLAELEHEQWMAWSRAVSGEVSDEDMDTIKRLCAYSPVHGLIAEAIEVHGQVTRA